MTLHTGNETRNLQVVQGMYEAFGRGDVQTIIASLSPTVQWEDFIPSQVPHGGLRKGPGEVARFFQELASGVKFERFEPTNFLASGDQVVVLGRYAGAIPSTGKKFDGTWVHVATVQDGKITHWGGYHEHETMKAAYTK